MKRLFNRKGNAYLELLITFTIIIIVVASLITIPPAYSMKQNVDYMARKLIRAAEVSGSTSNLDDLYNALCDQLGVTPTVQWNAEYIPGTHNIQLRDTFTLALSTEYVIYAFDIGLGEPTRLALPITTTLTGVSEVYFK